MVRIDVVHDLGIGLLAQNAFGDQITKIHNQRGSRSVVVNQCAVLGQLAADRAVARSVPDEYPFGGDAFA